MAGRHLQPGRVHPVRLRRVRPSRRRLHDGRDLAEAASFAGHQQLSNLCWIYDSNKITIEGYTDLAFTEDVASRFTGYGWAVQHVDDANDLDALNAAFEAFRAETGKPR